MYPVPDWSISKAHSKNGVEVRTMTPIWEYIWAMSGDARVLTDRGSLD